MSKASDEGNTEVVGELTWFPGLLSISLKFTTISLGLKMTGYGGRNWKNERMTREHRAR